MPSNEFNYYRKRAVDERKAAMAANDMNIAMVHEEMARQYEVLAQKNGERSYGLREIVKPKI